MSLKLCNFYQEWSFSRIALGSVFGTAKSQTWYLKRLFEYSVVSLNTKSDLYKP